MTVPVAAKWSAGVPSFGVGADGTLTVALPLKDGGTLAATLTFTMTAARALQVVMRNEPGAAGLTGFQAWSNT